MGGRRLFGLARRLEEVARATGHLNPIGLSPVAVRDAERRVSSELRNALRLPLNAAASADDKPGFRAASAARELGRDLRIDGLRPGQHLRLGTMRCGGDPKRWWIEPYAPGLPSVSVDRQGLHESLLGSAVLYSTKGERVAEIEAVSPEAAKRRRARVKLPGTAGRRDVIGPTRRVVSGGGPGTVKRA